MDTELKTQLSSKDPRERGKAIKSMAVSGNPNYISILEKIQQHDPDPRVQDYASKAAQHLQQFVKETSGIMEDQRPLPTKNGLETQKYAEAAASRKTPPTEEKKVSRADRDRAEKGVQRAFNLHAAGQTKKALKVFSKALERYPGLEGQTFTTNLAMELTGLSAEEAFDSLLDRENREALLKATQDPEKKKSRRPVNPLSVILLILSLVALVVVGRRFISTGMLDRYRVLIARQLGGFGGYSAGGYRYQLIEPTGKAPENGWPVVVALHGYGGQGADMMGIASLFTQQGIAYLAPTFGGYEPYPGRGPIESMRQILQDAGNQAPIDYDRVVLLGFSQGGTFAYRFSVYHPELVSGVVTAGAPDLDAGSPRKNIPYVFTWGDLDGLQDYVVPESVQPLINQGYNVRYDIIPGAGHEVTPDAIQTTIALAER